MAACQGRATSRATNVQNIFSGVLVMAATVQGEGEGPDSCVGIVRLFVGPYSELTSQAAAGCTYYNAVIVTEKQFAFLGDRL